MAELYNVSLSLLHISRNFDSSKMIFLSSSGNSKDLKGYRNRIKNSLVISGGSMSDVRHLTCSKVHLFENFDLPRCRTNEHLRISTSGMSDKEIVRHPSIPKNWFYISNIPDV